MNSSFAAENRAEDAPHISSEFIDAMFADDDILTAEPIKGTEFEEGHHILPIFDRIAKGSVATTPSSTNVGSCVTQMDGSNLSAVLSDTVLLAVPASLLETGLSAEQILEGIAKMRLIAKQLSPENLNFFMAACIPPESSLSPMGEDADSVRFPIFENGRCSHKKCWKRLRAKRGFAYFICLNCAIKWRSTSLSEKLRKQQQNPLDETQKEVDLKEVNL